MTKTFLLDTFSFFRANFIVISLIVIPFTIPLELFSFFYYRNIGHDGAGLVAFLPVVVYALLYAIFGAAIVFFIASVIKGHDITVSQAWALGIKHWPSYFMLTVILILTIGFGFALFILPGLFLAARFAFSEFDLLLNNQGPFESLRSSWEASREYFWSLLSGGLIITLIIYVPYWSVVSIFNEAGLYTDVVDAVLSIIESVLMVLYTIYAFRVYDFALKHSGT